MLVLTSNILALHCPSCGRLDFHGISLFGLDGKKALSLECSCGQELGAIGTRDRRNFWLQINCSICETPHLFSFTRMEIWSDKVLELKCPENLIPVAHIGPKKAVRESLRGHNINVGNLAKRFGFNEYFANPEAMYQVLEAIYHLAEEGRLYCHCGSYSVEVNIFPDRVDLHCDSCSGSRRIMAATDRDAEEIQQAEELCLEKRPTKRGRKGRGNAPCNRPFTPRTR